MFHTSSIWLTLALAVQRYIYVCHAPLARKFCTLANVYKCLGYILFFAFFHQVVELCSRKYTVVSKNISFMKILNNATDEVYKRGTFCVFIFRKKGKFRRMLVNNVKNFRSLLRAERLWRNVLLRDIIYGWKCYTTLSLAGESVLMCVYGIFITAIKGWGLLEGTRYVYLFVIAVSICVVKLLNLIAL